MYLFELNESIHTLRGIGSARQKAFSRLSVRNIRELLTHYPRDYQDRTAEVPLAHAPLTDDAVVRATVVAHDYIGRPNRRTLKVFIRDDSGTGALVCFGRNFLDRQLPLGREVLVWGQFKHHFGEISASTFEFEPAERAKQFGRILPLYPLSEGLTHGAVRDAVGQALTKYGDLVQDEIPAPLRTRFDLMTKAAAIRAIHFPDTMETRSRARRRLAFEELLLLQLHLARLSLARKIAGTVTRKQSKRRLVGTMINSLPFELTADQRAVLSEIQADLERPHPMVRLLQGDVGSGKTLVAAISALFHVERGRQAAFMAPTELLARQHGNTLAELFAPLSVRLGMALGSTPTSQRKHLAAAVGNGEIDVVVGTHALFAQSLEYADLGLVIVDEQHRFGVRQRQQLTDKGLNPDLMMMSATPIPRSLALTAFGDTDVSTIRTMPPGRVPVVTHLTKHGNEERVYAAVAKEISAGHQAYFVYPLIEETGNSRLRNVSEMEQLLSSRFPGARVGSVHSRVAEEDREQTMIAFTRGEIDILVATSVIEVGVNVANATCMVVDHAERFGLAALHQLRGRVGRSTYQSYCYLIYSPDLTEDAKERLRVLHSTTDGFEIAEEDLRIRGPGDLSGLRQSGFLRLSIADIRQDMELMTTARAEAIQIVSHDAGLLNQEHGALRRAVEHFGREEDVAD